MAYVNDPTQQQPPGPPAGGPAPVPQGPATTPAPAGPAPGAPTAGVPAAGATIHGAGAAPGVQAPAAPIGTPGTAASRPLKDSPWAYEKVWGALGSLGDPELDAAVKAATLSNLDNPFGEEAVQQAHGGIFERGMGGLRSQQQSMAADLARRGITGPAAAAMMAEAEGAARGQIASGQREASQQMRQAGAQYGLQSAEQARVLASDLAKRGVDIESLRMNREQLARQIQQARRAGAGGEEMLEIMNPDGTTSQVPMNILSMVLDFEEGGLF